MSPVKKAWRRIREQYETATQKIEGNYSSRERSPGINALIQTEYRAGCITEPERDAMRRHVEEWLPPGSAWEGGKATYSCGLWAPSVGPMGLTEHAIILSTVVILEAEAA